MTMKLNAVDEILRLSVSVKRQFIHSFKEE